MRGSGVVLVNVAAVIVTRGDVDLGPILDSHDSCPQIDFTYIWNNRNEQDLSVYGRYAALERFGSPVVLVQDDDCILPPESFDALLAAYQPGLIVANMPERFRPHYPDSCLVGFGAIFDRDLPALAFDQFFESRGEWLMHPLAGFRHDDQYSKNGRATFLRTCDVVFTTLTPRILLDLPYTDREFASDDTRMWKQQGHVGERQRMLELARQVRDAVPA